jgi:hypothetical protein
VVIDSTKLEPAAVVARIVALARKGSA